MLELRPNCELCDTDLPPDSPKACICTYECTFCDDCVEHVLHNVCPNCGGGFAPRPVRPKVARLKGKNTGLKFHPASTKRVNTPHTRQKIDALVSGVRHLKPSER